MEKILLIPILLISLNLTACQSKSKRLQEMRKQTQIESPYEITQSTENTEAAKAEPSPTAVATPSQPTTPVVKKESTKTSPTKAPAKPVEDKTKKVEVAPKAEVKKEEAVPVSTSFPFKVGEKVTYSITFFALEAGKMTMEVKPFKQIQGERTFHFYITATTSSVFSLFYSVKDFAESFWSEKFRRPYLMKIYGEESKYVREVQTSFNWAKKTARYQAKILKVGHDLEHEDKSWNLKSQEAQDVISALYYLRTFDLQLNKTYKMNVAEKGKDIVLTAEVVRKETLKTRAGTFQTIVVKPTFTVDGAWKQVGDILIWLTDDEHKTPINFEAKVKIGTIKGKLHSLKRP